MASSYKLIYFDFPGRAEPIRMLLSYGGLKFEDERIQLEDWPKFKPTTPFGKVPYLEIDGKTVVQSKAISRYLAKQVKLAGNNDWENMEIDSIVDTISDLEEKVMQYGFLEKNEDTKKELYDKLVNEMIPFYLKKLDDIAEINEGYLCLNRLTWADIYFLCHLEGAVNAMKKDYYADYPNLLKVKTNVLAIPSIKAWIKSRPACQLFSTYDLKQDL